MRWLYPVSLEGRAALGLLIVRLVAGGAMMQHGWGKIQSPFDWMGPGAPIPGILQALAAVSEFGGGLAWILGLLTLPASFGILCTMGVAMSTHITAGDPWVAKGAGGAWELAFGYLSLALLFMLAGPGRLSLDAALFGRKEPPPVGVVQG